VTLTEGLNRLTATAADAAGNSSAPSLAAWVLVDTQAPVLTPTVQSVSGRSVALAWRSSEAAALYTLQVSETAGLSWTTWLTTSAAAAAFPGLPGRSYAFRLRAVDALGNQGDWTPAITAAIAAVTKYYTLGNQKVAMRQGAAVYYLHGDHLGSTSLTTDASGAIVSEVRYLPYGETRWGNSGPTDFGFTGQRNEAGFGLMDYNARYYSPYLNQFISPDSIVPDFSNPQSLNRYAYALNNPVKYNDPSGHCVWDACVVEGAIIGAGIILAIDYSIQVKQNMDAGMSFWDAGYHQNVNTQELGGAMLGGAGGGALIAAAAPAAAPVLINTAIQADQFLQTPAGQITQGAGENVYADCLDGCTLDSAGKSAVEGAVISGIPYLRSRPSYGQNQVEDVWNTAKQSNGKVYDQFTGEELMWDKTQPRNGQWDMGHKPGLSYRDLHDKYIQGEITKAEFLSEYRNSDNYWPQSVNGNRGRRYD